MTGVPDPTRVELQKHYDEKIADLEKLLESETGRLDSLLKADVRRLEENTVALKRAIEEERAQKQIAQDKFEESVQRDSEKQNEFRQALSDLGKNMATKEQLAAVVKSQDEKTERARADIAELRSRLDVGNPDVGILQRQHAEQTGFAQGSDVTMGKIIAVIIAAFTGLAFVLSIVVFAVNLALS